MIKLIAQRYSVKTAAPKCKGSGRRGFSWLVGLAIADNPCVPPSLYLYLDLAGALALQEHIGQAALRSLKR